MMMMHDDDDDDDFDGDPNYHFLVVTKYMVGT